MFKINLKLISGVLCGAIAVLAPNIAKAQEVELNLNPTTFQPFAEPFNNTYKKHSGDFFQNTSFFSPLIDFLGFPFPEEAATKDAQNLSRLRRQAIQDQFSNTPVIRTTDLPSPYNTSIMNMPNTYLNQPTFGGN
jgi:hypothetical protein